MSDDEEQYLIRSIFQSQISKGSRGISYQKMKRVNNSLQQTSSVGFFYAKRQKLMGKKPYKCDEPGCDKAFSVA